MTHRGLPEVPEDGVERGLLRLRRGGDRRLKRPKLVGHRLLVGVQPAAQPGGPQRIFKGRVGCLAGVFKDALPRH